MNDLHAIAIVLFTLAAAFTVITTVKAAPAYIVVVFALVSLVSYLSQ